MFDKIKDIVSDVTGGKDLGDLDLGGYEKYLEGITWPVSKEELIAAVKNNGASDEIVNLVQGLGGDTFSGPQDIIGGLTGGGADSAKVAAENAADKAKGAGGDSVDKIKDLKKVL
jgi:hypothetical protein